MAAHSEKGPSSSSCWINCTPSAKLCAEFPNEATSYVQEGTDAHELCEYLLKKELGEDVKDPSGELEYYNQEMQEHCEDYRNYVMELVAEAKQKTKDVVVMVEQQIQYERFVKGGFGTADCIIIADGVLNVVDFKYGLGVEVRAEGNTQMQIYALGALEIFDALYDIDTVRMTIFQPRLSNISSATMSRDDLYKWAVEVLKPAADEADAGTGEFHTGDWCRFCRAKHICRERAKRNLELASYEFTSPPLLSDEEITEILDKVDNLLNWANDVKEYALQEAIGGKEWPGFKLVEGRSIRKYTDEQEAAKLAAEAGYDPYEKKVKTITELSKEMGKKKFEEVLGKVVVKPQGKPVLVREDDKRPALNTAKEDFK